MGPVVMVQSVWTVAVTATFVVAVDANAEVGVILSATNPRMAMSSMHFTAFDNFMILAPVERKFAVDVFGRPT
jgi:hypothetical protein